MSFAELGALWREGERRLAGAEGRERVVLDRIVKAIVEELRRRLGGRFTADELARFYLREGIDWCFEVARRTAPADPEAWDLSTVAGAAFARYVRQASDYAGGRQILPE